MAKRVTKADRIREERWEEVRERYESRESYSQIAKDIGVSPATMLKWLIEEGYKYRTKGRYPRAMKARAKEMLARDWEIEDVAELLKVEKRLVIKWYRAPDDQPKEKKPKDNPAPRRRQLSLRAQKLIGDPRVPRHKRGRRWELNQKRFVVRLIKDRYSIIEVYRIMGASKARQSKIWKELVGRHKTPPNFPTEKGPLHERRTLRETDKQRERRFRRDLRVIRRQEAKDKMEQRKKMLHERRRKATADPTRIEGAIPLQPPPAPGASPPPPPDVPAGPPPPSPAYIEPAALPPSRETELPRPPWERKKKKKPKKKKKKRRRRGR